MVEREYGFKKTQASGTDLTIKEKYEGTRESNAARRLACRDDVQSARVKSDGTIRADIRRHDHWSVSDVMPDDFHAVDVMVHPSSVGWSHAHIDIKRDD